MSWQTSSGEIGKGALQKQHELRYEALARHSREDHKIAAAYQQAIDIAANSNFILGKERYVPSARPATASHPLSEEIERAGTSLRSTLKRFGLNERRIVGDGNCQFRAVADQLFGSQDQHATVRDRAVAQLRSNPGFYGGFAVGENFEDYLERMSADGTWGDNLTLQATADAFLVEVNLITSFADSSVVVLSPHQAAPVGIVLLGFYAEFHYVSVEHAR